MPTILVVEDEAAILILAESVLKEAGYETLTASDVRQAYAVLSERNQHHVDLLFTDIRLGDTEHGGLDIAVRAVQANPAARVLYTSAQLVTDGMREMFVKGSDFISKPYTVPDLIAAIEKLQRPTN